MRPADCSFLSPPASERMTAMKWLRRLILTVSSVNPTSALSRASAQSSASPAIATKADLPAIIHEDPPATEEDPRRADAEPPPGVSEQHYWAGVIRAAGADRDRYGRFTKVIR